MHTEIVNPESITHVMLKNRKRFHVVKGSFRVNEPDSFSFEYREGGRVHEVTVARSYVALVESAVQL
jgi:hypothetical protein